MPEHPPTESSLTEHHDQPRNATSAELMTMVAGPGRGKKRGPDPSAEQQKRRDREDALKLKDPTKAERRRQDKNAKERERYNKNKALKALGKPSSSSSSSSASASPIPSTLQSRAPTPSPSPLPLLSPPTFITSSAPSPTASASQYPSPYLPGTHLPFNEGPIETKTSPEVIQITSGPSGQDVLSISPMAHGPGDEAHDIEVPPSDVKGPIPLEWLENYIDRVNPVRVIRSKSSKARLERFLDVNDRPLHRDHKVFSEGAPFEWISEVGTTIVIDEDRGEVAFAVRITPSMNVTIVQKQVMNNLMKWSDSTLPITTNSAHKHSADGRDAPSGIMSAVGWHSSYSKGKSVAAYVPKRGKEKEYEELVEDDGKHLKQILSAYREGFGTLVPSAKQILENDCWLEGIPNLGMTSYNPNESVETQETGPNVIAITHKEFSNLLHHDRDYSKAVYGWWWAADKGADGKYTWSPDVNHSRIKGGQFIVPEYGVGVDFERADGLVEIFWRGHQDHHSTMVSKDEGSITRWGTSMQLTRAIVNSIRKLDEYPARESRIVSPHDILDERKKKQKSVASEKASRKRS
ncbi:hypothetical protein PM082_012659 [Marasmius tenuissimus]|nr:hypothetical protein PM082_012659 [Marasmius tenuissimus]